MAWFTSNQLSIKTIEKDSGIIYAEQIDTSGTSTIADCGQPGIDHPIERLGQLNVFVREIDAATTQMTINSTFIERRMNGWTGAAKSATCVSTGVLESQILNAVS
jgi:hypothetical protein